MNSRRNDRSSRCQPLTRRLDRQTPVLARDVTGVVAVRDLLADLAVLAVNHQLRALISRQGASAGDRFILCREGVALLAVYFQRPLVAARNYVNIAHAVRLPGTDTNSPVERDESPRLGARLGGGRVPHPADRKRTGRVHWRVLYVQGASRIRGRFETLASYCVAGYAGWQGRRVRDQGQTGDSAADSPVLAARSSTDSTSPSPAGTRPLPSSATSDCSTGRFARRRARAHRRLTRQVLGTCLPFDPTRQHSGVASDVRLCRGSAGQLLLRRAVWARPDPCSATTTLLRTPPCWSFCWNPTDRSSRPGAGKTTGSALALTRGSALESA